MTANEQYEIIGKVVSDHEKAKRDLAALRAKAKGMAEFLFVAGSVLQEQGTMTGNEQQIITKRFNDSRTHSAPWPTWDVFSGLVNEIEAVKQDIAALEQRRKELGV